MTFVLHPLPPATAARLREGAVHRLVADTSPGYPCRQCLRDAEVGDELVLVSHDPFEADSPYRAASPIFLHATPCTPAVDDGVVPEQLAQRQLSVRGFDADAMLVDARLVDGAALAAALEEVFALPAVDVVHVHNAGAGCFAARATRAPG